MLLFSAIRATASIIAINGGGRDAVILLMIRPYRRRQQRFTGGVAVESQSVS